MHQRAGVLACSHPVVLHRCGHALPVIHHALSTAQTEHKHSLRHVWPALSQLCRRKPSAAAASAAAAAATHHAEHYHLPAPVTVDQLHDPARIGAATTAEVTVQDHGGNVSLSAYMRLPVEQYYELDPEMIRPLHTGRSKGHFALRVPRISLFNVWVEPLVHVAVTLVDDDAAVQVQAINWGIRGSDLIQSLNLDRRFSLSFLVRLTWTSAAAAATAGGSSDSFGAAPAASGGNGSTLAPSGTGMVHGSLDLDVHSEVIGPFQFMPRGVLEGSGNAVLRTLVGTLLPVFVRRLAADYERWATDPSYRARRAAAAAASAAQGVQAL